MLGLIIFLAMTAFTIMATFSCSGNFSTKDVSEYQYDVLSPWAQVDLIPLRGISPRLDSLSGKKIGLFANFKRAARPIQAEIERRLKERFPDIKISLFDSSVPNVDETETVNKEKFTAWAKEMDARQGRLQSEDFIIVVAGGPGVWMGLLQSAGGFGNYFVTKEIKLPGNWEMLTAKYRTLVPTYPRY
jgi:hypothetical protein